MFYGQKVSLSISKIRTLDTPGTYSWGRFMHHWSQFFLKIDIISKVLIRLDSICYLCTKCPKSRKTSSTPLVAWPVIISENERLTLLWYSWKTHVKKSTPEKEISAWLNPGPGCHDNYHKKGKSFYAGK